MQQEIFQKACELERVLQNLTIYYKGKQGEISVNPYNEIENCLALFSEEHPKLKDKTYGILEDIQEIENLTLAKVFEANKVFLIDEAIDRINELKRI